jgi:hypothetical protein
MDTETKEHKLDWIRKAPARELALEQVRDNLIEEARAAGASDEEIDEALQAPRWDSGDERSRQRRLTW